MPTLTIDDITVEVPEGTTILQRRPPGGRQDPHPLLPRGRAGHRRLPRLPGRGRGRQERSWPPARSPVDRGHEVVKTNTGAVREARQTVVELLLSRARRRLPDLRPQRRLRAAARWPTSSASASVRYQGEKTRRMHRRQHARPDPRHGQVHPVPALRDRLQRGPERRRPVRRRSRGFTTVIGPAFAHEPERRRVRAVRPVRRGLPGRARSASATRSTRSGTRSTTRPSTSSCRRRRRSAPPWASASATRPARS